MTVRRIALSTLALALAPTLLIGCSGKEEAPRATLANSAASETKQITADNRVPGLAPASPISSAASEADKAVVDAEQNAEQNKSQTRSDVAANAANPAPASPNLLAERKADDAVEMQKSAIVQGTEKAAAVAADAAASTEPTSVTKSVPQYKGAAGGKFGGEAAKTSGADVMFDHSNSFSAGRFRRAQSATPADNYRQSHIAMPAPVNPLPKPHAVYNPSMYVADTYIGGNGERDRLAKLIQAGVVVDGKRVKLEAFTHNYAQSFQIPQYTALNVSADTVQSKIIQAGAHTYLQIGLQAMKGELPRRPPLNLALVIDRSGSMGDEHKLEYAKTAAANLVDSLNPADTFSLVVFDDKADILVPAQHVTNKARIRRLISGLQPGGGTNIYEGLSRAYQQARKNASLDSVNRVILLSDGEVTVGVNDAQQFHHLAASQSDQDVETSAVGVGVEFNEDLMLSLARDGKGNYHFLKDGADTGQVFARELDELTHVVAKAVKLRVQLAPGVGLIRVLGAATLDAQQTAQVKADEKKIDARVAEELGIAANRQHVPEEPGIKMLIPAFYRGDSHVVMLEIKVPPQNANLPQSGMGNGCKIADVSVKYKDLVTMTNRTANTSVAVQYTSNKDDMIYSVNRGVKKNLLGFQTGEALMQAATLIEQGRVGEAVQRVDERRTVLSVAAQQWQDKDLQQDGALLDRYKSVLSQLGSRRQLAGGDFGQYLKRSLTYNGYQMTR